MDENYFQNEIIKISKPMFEKNFFGVFHGSISARIEHNQFIINKRRAIFNKLLETDLVILNSKKDYRWKDASGDSDIHLNIYKNIPAAKFICYVMPPYLTAYSLEHVSLIPKDYFTKIRFDSLFIHDIRDFDDWEERAPFEIYRYMLKNKTNVVIVRGLGLFVYERTSYDLAKTVALLENSCKLLQLSYKF